MSDAAQAGFGDNQRSLVAYFAHNPVAANVLMLLLLGGGLFVANRATVERFPAYDPHTIVVSVPYLGAAPAEVEEEITRRVEESVAGIADVERVLSTAAAGIGTITVEYSSLADGVEVLNAVRAAVERIENFPPLNAEQPEIVRREVVRKVLVLAVSAESLDEDALRQDAENLRAALLALPDVSMVSLRGTRQREIQIELSEEALRRHGLTINEVVRLVRQSSFNLSGGKLRTNDGEVIISSLAKRTRAEEFQDIVLVSRPDGSVVRVRDVATVRDGFEELDLINEVDGRPTIFVRVDAAIGKSTQEVAEAVKRRLADYARPPGTAIELWQDESRFISDRIATVTGNAIIGAVLVFITLLVVFDMRLALWIAMGIPISFLGALVFFDAVGLSVNVLTLFAFFIVTGIVVDDAVVVGESIARQRENGLRGAAASIAGVRAVGGPVAIGAVTTVVTFFALFPLGDAWGQLVSVMPLVILLVLAVSLVEAFCILPGHLAAARPWSLSPLADWQGKARAALDRAIHGHVVEAIALAVRYPFRTLLVVVLAVAAAAAAVAFDVARYTAFPSSIGVDRLQAALVMPVGTPFSATAAAAEQLAAAARAADQAAGGGTVAGIAVVVGRHRPQEYYEGGSTPPEGSHLATVEVRFAPPPGRPLTAEDFQRRWRHATGTVPGADTVSFEPTQGLFTTHVSHLLIHDDEDVLAQAVADLSAAYAAVPAIHEVRDSLTEGKRRFDVQLTAAGVAAGLTVARVANQLRDAFFGAEVQRIQRGSDELRVVVRYPAERRRSLRDLLDERILLPGGGDVPLATVASITETRDYAELLRIDGRRAATVTGWFDAELAGSRQVNAAVAATALPLVEARYPDVEIREHGATRDGTSMIRTLLWTFPLALVVVFGLLASQLRSFVQPLLVLAGVPLAAVGAVAGHMALGYDLTNMSLFGIIGVSGVVVNDTLLLLHRYNGIRRNDAALPAIAAISAAARQRARAIILTTATTVMGIMPMLYDKSEAIDFLVPMVISLGAGLLFSSLGVLFLVPAVLVGVEIVAFSRPLAFLRRREAGA